MEDVVMVVIKALYILAAVMLALYGVHISILCGLYLWHRRDGPSPPAIQEWPAVTIQLPLFNELYVVEDLLRAVMRMRYPRDKLQIQVLDDSTDETSQILQTAVARYRRAGIQIEWIHRKVRNGFKAGALNEAMQRATGEYIAIFDADFLPPADFLVRTIPYFASDERLGFIQTRWGHTNRDYSTLTRAQAIALDGHFVVEQTARQRGGLFMAFNGTAGIWRKACIESSGGWSSDTLCEDLDLSYRAQMAGWRCLFLPDVEAPAEIPAQMAALKRQQARWAHGSIQCLLKLGRAVLASHKPLPVRLLGLAHLGAYAVHPATLILALSALPLLLSNAEIRLPLAFLSIAGVGPPLMCLMGQIALYRDWPRRLLDVPFLMLIGIGLAWNNTGAILKALARQPASFQRTPKFHLRRESAGWVRHRYALGWDWSNAGELAMMLYAMVSIGVAIWRGHPGMMPFLALYGLAFGYVALYDVWYRVRRAWQRPWTCRAPVSYADYPPALLTHAMLRIFHDTKQPHPAASEAPIEVASSYNRWR